MEEKLSYEEYESEMKKRFRAQPIPSHAPFIPKKSSKAPTEPESLHLHLEERMEERKAFDEELKRKEEYELYLRIKKEEQEKVF